MLDISKVSIPSSPGCYLYKGKGGNIIYVGKAKNLSSRVRSYFSGKPLDAKTSRLVQEADSAEFIITDNEVEALLLENSLIKRHYPKYNVDLKDSERFTYIVVTDEEYPRLLLARKGAGGKKNIRGRWYGPFARGSARVLLVHSLRRAYGIRICKALPKKVCLQYHLGNCTGPCEGKIGREEYLKGVREVEEILSGEGAEFERALGRMKEEMKQESERKNFERALRLRDSIRILEGLSERQKMEREGGGDEDFIYYLNETGKTRIQLFKVLSGVVRDREKFSFESEAGRELEEFMMGYYEEGNIPRRIYVQVEFEGREALQEYLGRKRGGKVEILVPKIGDKKGLLGLLRRNIESEMFGKANPALLELKKILHLRELPVIIEAFDISTLFGENSVGSMVRFVNGKPDKSGYRRFRIRGKEEGEQDDFAMMREVVFRRYKRLGEEIAQEEEEGKEGKNKEMPNLILIDGGAGQLSSAISALEELSLDLECVSLAKQEEEIYSPKFSETIRLDKRNEGLKILMHARDEAHRFGINYHKLLRSKSGK